MLLSIVLIYSFLKKKRIRNKKRGYLKKIINNVIKEINQIFSIESENNNKVRLFFTIILIFIISNIIKFQPNWWDNTKVWVWILFFMSLFISAFFIHFWKKSIIMKVIVSMLFLSSVVSNGYITISPFFQKETIIFSAEELERAKTFQSEVPAEALVLADDYFHLFIGPLTPNQLFMGYDGWITSYGIDTGKKKRIRREIYTGGPLAKKYIEEEKIDYIIVDYFIRKKFKDTLDEKFLKKHTTKILTLTGNIEVYKVDK